MAEDQTGPRMRRNLQEGLRVSQTSLAWTMAAGSCAVGLGIAGNSLVLVAFGLIGLLDSVGSGSLILHFHHSLSHGAVSERHERLALAVVTAGMAVIGAATVADSAYRLSAHASSDPPSLGIALAGVSVVVLAVLSLKKRRISRRIPSHALHADGLLSALGSLLALVALAGTALDAALGWWWIDPVAAIAVASGAVGLSIGLTRRPDLRSRA